MEVCETIQTQRGGTMVIVKGYIMHKERNRDNIYYWKCAERHVKRCKARAITMVNGRQQHILKKFNAHSHHAPNSKTICSAKVVANIKEAAILSDECPAQIIQRELMTVDKSLRLQLPSSEALRKKIGRWRREVKGDFGPGIDEEFILPDIVRPRHTMEVYYSPYSPPSRAVLLTIKALGIQPELRELDLFQKAEHKQPWFRKINPTHTVPALNDDGFTLTESRAILAYLVNKYGKKDDPLYPTDARKRALVDRMLYFDMGSVYKSIAEYWHPQIFGGQPPDSQKENVLKQSLEYLDGFLNTSSGKYAAGDAITIADFSLISSITSLEVYDYDYEAYPIVTSWAEGLKKDLPYYQECVQDGLDKAKAFLQSQET